MKASLALLCLALACTAYAADINVDDLHKQLASVDPSLAAISSSKASTMGIDKQNYYKDDYYKYENKYEDNKYGKYDEYKYGYEKKYEDKYEPKYEKKYDEYEPKYEKKYDDKYGYEKKYDGYEKKYDSYEKKYDSYEPKYDSYGYEKKYDNKYYDYKHTDYYGSYGAEKKITLKLWEKSRGPLRPQAVNNHTWQFSSIVTCDNPKAIKDLHANDGVIDMPVNPDMKITPVGVCEWTVTEVAPQAISEHALIKGSTSVICTFTEEAERTCKGDFLCDKMSISASGLLYHFDKAPADYGYAKDGEKKAEGELDMDVMLSLVNGINGHKHKNEFDNGVLQYFYGSPSEMDRTAIKYAIKSDKEQTGEYTIVLKA